MRSNEILTGTDVMIRFMYMIEKHNGDTVKAYQEMHETFTSEEKAHLKGIGHLTSRIAYLSVLLERLGR